VDKENCNSVINDSVCFRLSTECQVDFAESNIFIDNYLIQKADQITIQLLFLISKAYNFGIIKKFLKDDPVVLKEKIGLLIKNKIISADKDISSSGEKNTLCYLFRSAVDQYLNQTLLKTDSDGYFTYSDTEIMVINLLKRLQSVPLKSGDIVAVYAPLSPETFILFWACILGGYVFTPLDINTPFEKTLEIIKSLHPALLLHSVNVTEKLLFERHLNATDIKVSGLSVFMAGQPSEAHPIQSANIDMFTRAVILFTSGTTSIPKGVELNQGVLYRSAAAMSELTASTKEDTMFSLADLHTMSGLRNPFIVPFFSGSSVYIPGRNTSGNLFLIPEQICNNKVTILATAPFLLRKLLQFKTRINQQTIESLRLILCTGSKLSTELAATFEEHFHKSILNYYGLTETTGLCSGNRINDNRTLEGSIGIAVNAVTQIADEKGNVLPYGETGELRIFSDNLFDGYFDDKHKKSELIKENWLYSGDLAIIRRDGHIFIKGRKREVIKNVYTELIYPEEIERTLELHHSVAEACVCGFELNHEAEGIAAFIVPSRYIFNEKQFVVEIKQHIKEILGSHKIPDLIFFENELPKGTNGKLLRRILKEKITQMELTI